VIEASAKAVLSTPIVDDPVTVVFSRNGWVRARQGHDVDAGALTFKEGDGLASLIPCRTADPVVFVDSAGRAYSITASELPSGRGDGVPASSLVEVQNGAKLVHCVAGRADTAVMVAATGGYGFITKLADLVSNRRAGRDFMTLDDGHGVLPPVAFAASPQNYVALATADGRLLLIKPDEVKVQPRGRGVNLIAVDRDEALAAFTVTDAATLVIEGTARGGKDKALELSGRTLGAFVGKRAQKGRFLSERLKIVRIVGRRIADPV
jgi:topoisomerase IV subunit A